MHNAPGMELQIVQQPCIAMVILLCPKIILIQKLAPKVLGAFPSDPLNRCHVFTPCSWTYESLPSFDLQTRVDANARSKTYNESQILVCQVINKLAMRMSRLPKPDHYGENP